jgi:hypothetical protein
MLPLNFNEFALGIGDGNPCSQWHAGSVINNTDLQARCRGGDLNGALKRHYQANLSKNMGLHGLLWTIVNLGRPATVAAIHMFGFGSGARTDAQLHVNASNRSL